jgi:hypothetical protein
MRSVLFERGIGTKTGFLVMPPYQIFDATTQRTLDWKYYSWAVGLQKQLILLTSL